MTTTNMIDITDLSDAALDAVLAVRSGADYVDASHLTPADRLAIAQALGWDLRAYVRDWIAGEPAETPKGATPIHRVAGPCKGGK